MHVSFGMAEQYKGVCFLRFDDTNPEAEKQEYIDHIEDIVSWLGWKPFKVPPPLGFSPQATRKQLSYVLLIAGVQCSGARILSSSLPDSAVHCQLPPPFFASSV